MARKKRPPLSEESKKAHYDPLPVEILADALQDTVHKDIGRGRAAKTVRNKGQFMDRETELYIQQLRKAVTEVPIADEGPVRGINSRLALVLTLRYLKGHEEHVNKEGVQELELALLYKWAQGVMHDYTVLQSVLTGTVNIKMNEHEPDNPLLILNKNKDEIDFEICKRALEYKHGS